MGWNKYLPLAVATAVIVITLMICTNLILVSLRDIEITVEGMRDHMERPGT